MKLKEKFVEMNQGSITDKLQRTLSERLPMQANAARPPEECGDEDPYDFNGFAVDEFDDVEVSDDDSDSDYIEPEEGTQVPTREKCNSEKFKGRTPLPPPPMSGATPPVRRPSDVKQQPPPRQQSPHPPPHSGKSAPPRRALPPPPPDDEPSPLPSISKHPFTKPSQNPPPSNTSLQQPRRSKAPAATPKLPVVPGRFPVPPLNNAVAAKAAPRTEPPIDDDVYEMPASNEPPPQIPENVEEETYLAPSSPKLPPRVKRSTSPPKAVPSPLSASPATHSSNFRGSQISVSSSRSSVSSIGGEPPPAVPIKSPGYNAPLPLPTMNEGRALPPTPQQGRGKLPTPTSPFPPADDIPQDTYEILPDAPITNSPATSKTNRSMQQTISDNNTNTFPSEETYEALPDEVPTSNEPARGLNDNKFKPEKSPRVPPWKIPKNQIPAPPPPRASQNDDVYTAADDESNISGGSIRSTGSTDSSSGGRPLPLIPPSMDRRDRKISLQEAITNHKPLRKISETTAPQNFKAGDARVGHSPLPSPLDINTQVIRNVQLKPTAKSLFEKQVEKSKAPDGSDDDDDDNNNRKGVGKLAAKFEKGPINLKPTPLKRGPLPTPPPVKKEVTPPPVDLKQPNRDSGFESGSATVVRGCLPPKARPAIATPEELLQKQPWYFGSLTRKQAEPMLTNSTDGTFLIRDSTKSITQPYTLDVWFQGKLRRLPIRKRTDQRLALGSPKEDEDSFGSLNDLVTHHQQKIIIIKGTTPDSGDLGHMVDGQASGGTLLRRSPPKHN